jgi:hypothetical protein
MGLRHPWDTFLRRGGPSPVASPRGRAQWDGDRGNEKKEVGSIHGGSIGQRTVEQLSLTGPNLPKPSPQNYRFIFWKLCSNTPPPGPAMQGWVALHIGAWSSN